jgi:D-alanyl-D-alanine carboxypeptidase
MDQQHLDRLLHRTVGRADITGAVLHVSSGDGATDLISAAGDFRTDSAYYIASINKLLMSSLILRFATGGVLALDDRFADYVSDDVIAGLHVLDGRDYSRAITLRHMISQTSGLPDYLDDRLPNGHTTHQDLRAGLDPRWPVQRVVATVKQMRPHFPPGQRGKAKYIDTNHQLLELVVESVTGRTTAEVLHDLFAELGMSSSYVASDPADRGYIPVRYHAAPIGIGTFISSTGNDIISTARDQMIFLKAFFAGHFWPAERLSELQQWRRVFFPFSYGVGLQRFALPAAFTLFRRVPPLIGHAGSVGSVAFYAPERDLYFTGTVNQEAKPSAAFQAIAKALAQR